MNTFTRFACAAALLSLALVWQPVSAADAPKKGLADGDFKIGPTYTKAPQLTFKEGTPKGTVHEFTMDSKDSKIYPGIKGEYKRKVWVYIPHGYAAGKALPFIVIQDAMARDAMTKTLDNLIHQHRLPAIAAIFISSGGGDAQGSERGLEYDTVSGTYAEFIESEVLPRIEKEYKVKFTTDPEGRATMGGSSGAAAAFSMAWFHPDLYHRVLSYSGTYVNQQSPKNPESPHGAWEYHENFIPKSDAKPLRIWLEVGEKDNGWDKDEKSYHNWVMANERMAAALKEKGYHYRYVFAAGAGHVDGRAVDETLPEAMLWLWEGYPVK